MNYKLIAIILILGLSCTLSFFIGENYNNGIEYCDTTSEPEKCIDAFHIATVLIIAAFITASIIMFWLVFDEDEN